MRTFRKKETRSKSGISSATFRKAGVLFDQEQLQDKSSIEGEILTLACASGPGQS